VNCRICKARLGASFLNLGRQALANNLAESKASAQHASTYPLEVARCVECGTVQLTETVPPRALFGHYLYETGVSAAFRTHFAQYAQTVAERIGEPGPVIDIGSNDGTLLSYFKEAGWPVCGIDPATNLVERANERGIFTLLGFWDDEMAAQAGPAKLITANNVFAHTQDLHDFIEAVKLALEPDGWFVFEVVDLKTMLQAGTFDLLYHEHIFTHSVGGLVELFARHDMEVVDVEDVSSHGGSLRCYVRHVRQSALPSVREHVMTERSAGLFDGDGKVFQDFAERADRVRRDFVSVLAGYRNRGLNVVGYTCPAKAATLLNYCGITGVDLDYIVDDNPLKQGRWLPQAGIPIRGSDEVDLRKAGAIVVFAWNVADEIIPKLPPGPDIIVPMPTPRVVKR